MHHFCQAFIYFQPLWDFAAMWRTGSAFIWTDGHNELLLQITQDHKVAKVSEIVLAFHFQTKNPRKHSVSYVKCKLKYAWTDINAIENTSSFSKLSATTQSILCKKSNFKCIRFNQLSMDKRPKWRENVFRWTETLRVTQPEQMSTKLQLNLTASEVQPNLQIIDMYT